MSDYLPPNEQPKPPSWQQPPQQDYQQQPQFQQPMGQQYPMQQQPYTYQPAPKDPSTAFLIEFVGGFFGLLGVGYFYTGRMEEGIVRLIGWFMAMTIGWIITGILTALTGICGCILIPAMLIAQVGVPYWSADQLKKSMTGFAPPPPSQPMV